MIWKLLSATVALFIFVLAYFVWLPTDASVLTNLASAAATLPWWPTISAGFNRISTNAFTALVIGIIIGIIAIIAYLFAASQAEEETSYEF